MRSAKRPRMRTSGLDYGAIAARRAVRPIVRYLRYRGLRSKDALLASYLKSGNTWLRFMLAELFLGRDPEWEDVDQVIPYVGENRGALEVFPGSGRMFYTHDTASGPCQRIVYLVRDVRDVVLSEHRWVIRGGTERDLDEHVRDFVAGRSHIFGSWTDHVNYWLDSETAQRGDLLLVHFEDLRADATAVLTQITDFLGVRSSHGEIVASVDDHTLERMREKEDRAPASVLRRHDTEERFVGEGGVGHWRAKLTDEQTAIIEASTGTTLARLGYPLGSGS